MTSLGSMDGIAGIGGGANGVDETDGGGVDDSGSGDRGGEDRTRSITADTNGSDSSDDDSGSTGDSALDSFVGEIENG